MKWILIEIIDISCDIHEIWWLRIYQWTSQVFSYRILFRKISFRWNDWSNDQQNSLIWEKIKYWKERFVQCEQQRCNLLFSTDRIRFSWRNERCLNRILIGLILWRCCYSIVEEKINRYSKTWRIIEKNFAEHHSFVLRYSIDWVGKELNLERRRDRWTEFWCQSFKFDPIFDCSPLEKIFFFVKDKTLESNSGPNNSFFLSFNFLFGRKVSLVRREENYWTKSCSWSYISHEIDRLQKIKCFSLDSSMNNRRQSCLNFSRFHVISNDQRNYKDLLLCQRRIYENKHFRKHSQERSSSMKCLSNEINDCGNRICQEKDDWICSLIICSTITQSTCTNWSINWKNIRKSSLLNSFLFTIISNHRIKYRRFETRKYQKWTNDF